MYEEVTELQNKIYELIDRNDALSLLVSNQGIREMEILDDNQRLRDALSEIEDNPIISLYPTLRHFIRETLKC